MLHARTLASTLSRGSVALYLYFLTSTPWTNKHSHTTSSQSCDVTAQQFISENEYLNSC